MADMSDQVIFITGATSGIGRAVGRRFAADGARVILNGRRKERLEIIQSEIGERCHILPFDVSDRAAVEAAFAALPAEFSGISVLLNNAGNALGADKAQDASLDDWEQMVDINCKGVMYCTHVALPGMLARNQGHIINVGSSTANHKGPAGCSVYAGTKSFVHYFTYNLRSDILGSGVHVTLLVPGNVETEFAYVQMRDEAQGKAHYTGFETVKPMDMAEVVHAVVSLPANLNVNEIEVMPIKQAFGPRLFHKDST
jgi:NADP-dependent 3-hydroxy acid dehydrogenase YdfG